MTLSVICLFQNSKSNTFSQWFSKLDYLWKWVVIFTWYATDILEIFWVNCLKVVYFWMNSCLSLVKETYWNCVCWEHTDQVFKHSWHALSFSPSIKTKLFRRRQIKKHYQNLNNTPGTRHWCSRTLWLDLHAQVT